jgi:hypothetical protein
VALKLAAFTPYLPLKLPPCGLLIRCARSVCTKLTRRTCSVLCSYADRRRTDEEIQAEGRLQGISDHEDRMDHLREREAMEYNAVKAKLTNDIHQLEQQVELMRATYQLNSEKLDYNYQVLKKRSEENAITISQQKRKISRMQDNINNLRLRGRKQEKDGQSENVALTEDFKRIADRFKELQKKFRHFQVCCMFACHAPLLCPAGQQTVPATSALTYCDHPNAC